MAVELRNRLNRAFTGAYTASNTVVFDYPDIAALAAHLAGELAEVAGADAAPAVQPDPAPVVAVGRDDAAVAADGIAIVGMACRFPGAPDLDAFRRLLEDGQSAVTEGRRDPVGRDGESGDSAAGGGAYRHGGFIEGIDRFDARFFGIRPIEAPDDGPASAAAAGDELAGARGRGYGSRRNEGRSRRGVRGTGGKRVP